MASLERHDITGKYSEKIELQKELKKITRAIMELETEMKWGSPKASGPTDIRIRLIELQNLQAELKNRLFRLDPSE